MKTSTTQKSSVDNSWDGYEKKLLRNPGMVKALKETAIEFEIARAVIEARLSRGLTQKELAIALKTKQSVISRVENAKTMPSLAFLQRLAKMLGYSLQISLKPVH